jgi:transcriptional regulator with XRE-family HTH domain
MLQTRRERELLESFRVFYVSDVVRALRDILGASKLSDELGISSAMLSKYARRRSKPNWRHAEKIVSYLIRNADFLVESAARVLATEVHRREFYVLIALIAAFENPNTGIVIGFSDALFPIASYVSQFLDVPLGAVWYTHHILPLTMECRFDRCGVQRQVICYSLPKVTASDEALILISPFVRECTVESVVKFLKRQFTDITLYYLFKHSTMKL